MGGHSKIAARRLDGRRALTKLFQPQGSSPSERMYLGLSCPNRLFSAELGDTKINTRIQGVLVHRANLNLGSSLVPLREGVDNPCVSLLGLAFGYLCQSLSLNVHMSLRRVSGALATPRKGSPYLRMRRGRRPTVSIVNGCGHGGKVDGNGVPPGWRQRHRGRTSPPSPNPREGTTKRRMKTERRGK
jgi:hypothetical protein